MSRLRRPALLIIALAACVLPAAAAVGHELDHPAAPIVQDNKSTAVFQSGGTGAKWEFLKSFSTNNLQSDLDFFKQGDEMFASVGTFAAGENGGQSIFRITQEGGKTVNPTFVASHPSASCVPGSGVTGLQHDVEATPKGVPAPGDVLYNTTSTAAAAVKADTQLLIDATDAAGRCHDNGLLGQRAPRGGLEFIDVANRDQSKEGSVSKPNEIALTSHIGESHTVNVDPKRPHIAYSVTSDSVNVDANGKRANETSGFGLDGFEVVNFRSCLEAPLGTVPPGSTSAQKRELCKPEVFRYRYPATEVALGHTLKTNIFACHELEIYADDRLTCGSGAAAIVLDMKGAFDDNGTPTDFTDDTPRGTPLPCSVRESTSINVPPGLKTGAKVFDCVNGQVDGEPQSLTVQNYPQGNDSLQGVRYVGSITHTGRANAAGNQTVVTRPSDQDIDFNHETELTESGKFLLATDERGGGVLPPGATCAQGADNPQGNGGVHAYRVDRLRDTLRDGVPTVEQADEQYARTSGGKKAIYRAPIRTVAEETECTAHVMQQVPGQNRIFMGWYSQGTQVVDFTENADGTIDFKEAGFFIPANANQWVSHVYRTQENCDGTFTYHGTAGDFLLSNGRNTVEFFKVTLPAPQASGGESTFARESGCEAPGQPGPGQPGPGQPGQTGSETTGSGRSQDPPAATTAAGCSATRTITSAAVRQSRREVSFAFRAKAPVTIDLFQQSTGRVVIGERLVKRFRDAKGTVRWNGRDGRGRSLSDGYYVARFGARGANGRREYRRLALRRRDGRFVQVPGYANQDTCGLVRTFKIERPVFGGRSNRALNVAFRLGDEARGTVTVARAGGKIVKTYPDRTYRGGLVHRLRLTVKPSRFPRGRYVVTLRVRAAGGKTVTRRLSSFRI